MKGRLAFELIEVNVYTLNEIVQGRIKKRMLSL